MGTWGQPPKRSATSTLVSALHALSCPFSSNGESGSRILILRSMRLNDPSEVMYLRRTYTRCLLGTHG